MEVLVCCLRHVLQDSCYFQVHDKHASTAAHHDMSVLRHRCVEGRSVVSKPGAARAAYNNPISIRYWLVCSVRRAPPV